MKTSYQIEYTSGGDSSFEDETKLITSRYELLEYEDDGYGPEVLDCIDEFYVNSEGSVIDVDELSEKHGYYDYDIGDGHRIEGEFKDKDEAIKKFQELKNEKSI